MEDAGGFLPSSFCFRPPSAASHALFPPPLPLSEPRPVIKSQPHSVDLISDAPRCCLPRRDRRRSRRTCLSISSFSLPLSISRSLSVTLPLRFQFLQSLLSEWSNFSGEAAAVRAGRWHYTSSEQQIHISAPLVRRFEKVGAIMMETCVKTNRGVCFVSRFVCFL